MKPLDPAPAIVSSRWALRALQGLAVLCGLVATGLAIGYADQKPLDLFSFRQTQTAITAYWLARNGFGLAYETPVLGEPWSVPFEFPIYQEIVALLSLVPGTRLDAIGRLVGFGFLVACVPQVLAVTRRLRLAPLVFPIFCVLLFSSPTYVYWGRSFMIETTALFFCVAAARCFVDLAVDGTDRRAAWLLAVFLSLGMLQKITTALPLVLVLAPAYALMRMRRQRTAGRPPIALRDVATAALCFGAPMLVGVAWTLYADHLKLQNPFGRQLTSTALRSWNLGTAGQRLEWPLYEHVFLNRIAGNLGGLFGLLVLSTGLVAASRRTAWIVGVALLLGLLPVLLFANLHLSHDYYECGNLIFVLFAVAVALGDVLARRIRSLAVLLLAVGFIVVRNDLVFVDDYLPQMQAVYLDSNDTEMAIATVLQAEVPADRVFVAFDFDWTSSLAYLSERKAFMVPALFRDVERARADPTAFVDAAKLGAVVACPKSERRLAQLVDWSTRGRAWKIGLVDDCLVAVPERGEAKPSTASTTSCAATAIDLLPIPADAAMGVVRVRLPRPAPGTPASTYLAGPSPGAAHEMLDVTRRSPRAGVDRGALPDLEFTRLVRLDDADTAAWRVYRRGADRVDECRVVPVSRSP